MCDICGKPVRDRRSLNQHLTSHMNREEFLKHKAETAAKEEPEIEMNREWLCQECGKVLKSESKSPILIYIFK